MRLVLLLLLLHDSALAAVPVFNHDIAKRVSAKIRENLFSAETVNAVNKQLHKVEGVSLTNIDQLRQVEFGQLLAFPSVSMVYAGFADGFFIGHMLNPRPPGTPADFPDGYRFTMIEADPNYVSRQEPPHPVRRYWNIDPNTGKNVGWSFRNRTSYNPKIRPWYVEAKAAAEAAPEIPVAIWSSLYIFHADQALGITHIETFLDEQKKLFGCLCVDQKVDKIQDWLVENIKTKGNIVFITEGETGNLVASSVGDQPVLQQVLQEDGSSKLGRVQATQAAASIEISMAGAFLKKQNWDPIDSLNLIANGTLLVEMTSYVDGSSLNWKVVVIQPAVCGSGSLLDPSTLWCVMCGLGKTVRGGNVDATALDANVESNAVILMDETCGCQKLWNYVDVGTSDAKQLGIGKQYIGCDETDDWPNNLWCYVREEKNGVECAVAIDSLHEGETRRWRKCSHDEDASSTILVEFLQHPCEECIKGKFKKNVGDQACSQCPKDTFSDVRGATTKAECTACPAGRTTAGVSGAATNSSCVCQSGVYYTGSAGECA